MNNFGNLRQGDLSVESLETHCYNEGPSLAFDLQKDTIHGHTEAGQEEQWEQIGGKYGDKRHRRNFQRAIGREQIINERDNHHVEKAAAERAAFA